MASRLVCQCRFESANRFTNQEGNTRADTFQLALLEINALFFAPRIIFRFCWWLHSVENPPLRLRERALGQVGLWG